MVSNESLVYCSSSYCCSCVVANDSSEEVGDTVLPELNRETWKVVSEFPIYSVSNLGRVRNNERNYIMHGGYDRDGYRQVTLSYNDKQYNRRICRLVAIAFIPNPDNLPVVNHKDENRENDRVDNLEWCTVKYNNNYGTKLQKTRKMVRCVETNCIFESVRKAGKDMHIAHPSISKACKTGCTAGGFHWQYVDSNLEHLQGRRKYE